MAHISVGELALLTVLGVGFGAAAQRTPVALGADAWALERRDVPEPAAALNLAPFCRWFTGLFACDPGGCCSGSASTTAELIQGHCPPEYCTTLASSWGLHRLMDGTLLGLIAAVVVLAGLTLHWQYRWTVAFRLLEATRTRRTG